MEKIKSFIYLDSKKMYSLASQIFEGLVDSYIQTEKKQENQSDQQKGPFASGRTLADIIITEHDKTESKFLHDYLYNMFENKLISLNKVTQIQSETVLRNLKPLSFIKVTGRAIFNDSKEIFRTLTNYNKIGEILAYITLMPINAEKKNQPIHISKVSTQEVKKFIEDNNLQLDKDFLEKFKFILEYGLNDIFELQIKKESAVFSTVLDRRYLKEEEQFLISKYSRSTEVDITIFGVVTQTFSYLPLLNPVEYADELSSLKSFFRYMVYSLMNVENTFIGKKQGEIILDPIAVYVEL